MVEEQFGHDLTCVPYAHKGRYVVQTTILLVVVGIVFLYLWTINPLLSLLMIVFYLGTNYFQAYCCVYQDCPYVGQFCPAVFGIFPANLIARRLSRKGITRSKKKFERHATIAFTFWLGIVFLPVYWLYLLDLLIAIGYVVFQIASFLIFTLTVCPKCAIRDTCPAGAIPRRLGSS